MLGIRARDGRLVDLVSRAHVRGRPTPGVSGDTAPALARLEVQRDGDHGLVADLEIDRVCVGHLPAGNGYPIGTVLEGKLFQGGGVDSRDTSFSTCWEGDGGGGYGQVAPAEGIAYLDAQTLGPDGKVESLPEGCVLEDAAGGLDFGKWSTSSSTMFSGQITYVWGWRHVIGLDQLRHRRPCGHPMVILRRGVTNREYLSSFPDIRHLNGRGGRSPSRKEQDGRKP